MGVYSIFTAKAKGSTSLRQPYVRVVGVTLDHDGPGRMLGTFTPDDEDEIRRLAKQPDIHLRLTRSIAPSIFGSEGLYESLAFCFVLRFALIFVWGFFYFYS